MIDVYLFDWGDTLMVDFPDVEGKMCDWAVVEVIAGAKQTLQALSKHAKIYVATGAAKSTQYEIQRAFERVGLDGFISGYFCKDNLGITKGTPEFLNTILDTLSVPATMVAMVGDNFDKDIKPALDTGIKPFWLTEKSNDLVPGNVTVIKQLNELWR